MSPPAAAAAAIGTVWVYRALIAVVAAQAALTIVPSVRSAIGFNNRVMRTLALALCPSLGIVLGCGVRVGVGPMLHDFVTAVRGDDELVSAVEGTMPLSPRCTGMAGMSIVVSLTLAITVFVRLLQTSVLPWVFPSFWDPLPEDKKLKMIGCFVALNVRLAALIVLLPSFYSRFTIEHGLTFQATADSRWCDAHAPDRVHAAGFHAAACWLVTLLIWEVTFLPNLQWDDWVHHVLTAVVLSWFTDDTLQSRNNDQYVHGANYSTRVAHDDSRRDHETTADESSVQHEAMHPAISAIVFIALLGASIACFNYVTLLVYHCAADSPRVQAIAMGTAAVFSWGWQVPLFLYYPLRLVYTHTDSLGSTGSFMYAALAVCFFVVDSKCNVVRLMIMRDKMKLADDLANGSIHHVKSGASSEVVANSATAPPRSVSAAVGGDVDRILSGMTSDGDDDSCMHDESTPRRIQSALTTSWDEALRSESGLSTTGWMGDLALLVGLDDRKFKKD